MNTQLKLILTILLFSFICSCASGPKRIQEERNFYSIDYTKYTDQGFLMTPYKYNGEYESIASVEFEYFPEATRIGSLATLDDINTASRTKYIIRNNGQFRYKVAVVDLEEVMDGIYNFAKDKGADAIVDLKINRETKSVGGLIISGVSVRGFAINRK